MIIAKGPRVPLDARTMADIIEENPDAMRAAVEIIEAQNKMWKESDRQAYKEAEDFYYHREVTGE